MAALNGSGKTIFLMIGFCILLCLLVIGFIFLGSNNFSVKNQIQTQRMHPQITQFHDHRL